MNDLVRSVRACDPIIHTHEDVLLLSGVNVKPRIRRAWVDCHCGWHEECDPHNPYAALDASNRHLRDFIRRHWG